MERGKAKKRLSSQTDRPVPRCVAIVPVPCSFAGGGCKTPEPFDKTVFTKAHCIPDNRNSSIVGKVVVINSEPKRYEYQHPAYQLILADGGNGATGGRGNAVFGTCLATGERARWERYDVLGEIKPECMPQWAKEVLEKIKEQQKERKQKSREER